MSHSGRWAEFQLYVINMKFKLRFIVFFVCVGLFILLAFLPSHSFGSGWCFMLLEFYWLLILSYFLDLSFLRILGCIVNIETAKRKRCHAQRNRLLRGNQGQITILCNNTESMVAKSATNTTKSHTNSPSSTRTMPEERRAELVKQERGQPAVQPSRQPYVSHHSRRHYFNPPKGET